MKIKILINDIKPCSINKAYYARNKVLTKEARDYRERFLSALNNQPNSQALMQAFKAAFRPSEHCIKVSLLFMIPEDVFYTKKNEISMRSGDVDNYVKLTQDFLFNEKYFNDPLRLENGNCFNLGIDDRFVSDISVSKRPAHQWAIQISVEIVDLVEASVLPDICHVEDQWII